MEPKFLLSPERLRMKRMGKGAGGIASRGKSLPVWSGGLHLRQVGKEWEVGAGAIRDRLGMNRCSMLGKKKDYEVPKRRYETQGQDTEKREKRIKEIKELCCKGGAIQ